MVSFNVWDVVEKVRFFHLRLVVDYCIKNKINISEISVAWFARLFWKQLGKVQIFYL